jgi:hypothetical protein
MSFRSVRPFSRSFSARFLAVSFVITPMPRRFQFSLRRLFVATGLVALCTGTFLAATRCYPPSSIVVFIFSCSVCGAAIGSLFTRTLMGVAWWLAAGVAVGGALIGYMVSTSDL